MKIILQKDYLGSEFLLAIEQSLLGKLDLVKVSMEELRDYREDLLLHATPVGTVEFLKEAFKIVGSSAQWADTYPSCLSDYLCRHVEQIQWKDRKSGLFIKPQAVKTFTGLVWEENIPTSETEHINGDTWCWQAETVKWLCEWRYYIQKGKIIGMGRYDDLYDNALVPNAKVVSEMANAFYQETGIDAVAIDAGVLEDGRTALVEVNDAWATGYYKGTLSGLSYFSWLESRWAQMTQRAALTNISNQDSPQPSLPSIRLKH